MRKIFPVKYYKQVKALVYNLDNGTCHICKKSVAFKDATLDHIIPCKNHDASNEYWNLRIAHHSCNSSRHDGRKPGQIRLPITVNLVYPDMERRKIDPVSCEPVGKTELLQLRLSKNDKGYIIQEAQKLRISISAFTRMMILYWKGEIKHP